MKKLTGWILFSLLSNFSFSQTNSQSELVNQFFNHSGGNTLQDAAHPACTWSHASVQPYTGHIYYITLHYTQVLTSKGFSCQYKLKMDNTGRFISLRKIECNCPNFTCFWACSGKEADNITTYNDRIRYEKYEDKSLENMSCEEYTNAKLFFQWSDYGYYKKY